MDRDNMQKNLFRRLCGRAYHIALRYNDWFLSGKKIASKRKDEPLFPVVAFHHESPLIRNLPRSEMQLQYNKIINLNIAIERLNRHVLMPGEVFSYWYSIGNPTRAKGYLEGMVLKQGKIGKGIGGGLCQLSNLIYWMTLHTPLEVIERWRHSYDVFPDTERKLPFGSGATCAYPYLDLQIKNTTNEPFQLLLWTDDKDLIGEWRCNKSLEYQYRIYESDHSISHEPPFGYVRRNIIRRESMNCNGLVVNDELVTENRALMMYAPYIADYHKHRNKEPNDPFTAKPN